jgi:hypothetical protein
MQPALYAIAVRVCLLPAKGVVSAKMQCVRIVGLFWLPVRDSNPDMLLQRQLSYR